MQHRPAFCFRGRKRTRHEVLPYAWRIRPARLRPSQKPKASPPTLISRARLADQRCAGDAVVVRSNIVLFALSSTGVTAKHQSFRWLLWAFSTQLVFKFVRFYIRADTS
jgi:hypothetical protein